MALYTDTNGFPEGGFPVLSDVQDNLILNTLYQVPQKYLNYRMDVVGNNRLLGNLVIGGTLTGVSSLTMSGALSGVTTLGASSTVTLSSDTAPLTLSGTNAVLSITGANASIGTSLSRVNKTWLKDLNVLNRPTIGEDYAALVGDLRQYAFLPGRVGDILKIDEIQEFTSSNGVKIDGIILKDIGINFEVGATTRIFKDGSNNLSFTDVVTGTKTLAELAAASSYVYNNATPMPETVGGYERDTTFTNQSLDDMFDGLLYPYQYPSFLTFTISGQTTPIEVGNSIAANRTFTWTTENDSNINSNSIVIRDVTGSTDIATGLANDGTETVTYGAITKTTATTNQFSITGTNSKSETFNKTYTVTWQWRRYYGTSALTTLDETGIETLADSELASGYAKTYALGAGGYKYICYAAVLGTATSFKDAATGLNVPMEPVYTVSVTTNTSTPVTTNYNVHRSTNILGSAIDIQVS